MTTNDTLHLYAPLLPAKDNESYIKRKTMKRKERKKSNDKNADE